ncbi:Divalent-cation tolerance protein CutA [Rickettsiales bacterium Ac37b]|nr:Divalent-cation tolerance protein CutA [Rickettsiales bacterium Ac37b]
MSCTIIYTTFQNRDEAITIAKTLVEEKLVACANVIDKAISIYRWNDQVEESVETVLVSKTTKVKLEETISKIKQLHKYECPCIVTFDITGGDIDYINWIKNSV